MSAQLESNIPKHIGIILDGNRRFAKKLVMQPWRGHEMGAAKIENLFDWLKELGVKELTLYCFSLENFNRPRREFDFLMNIFKKEFTRLKTHESVHSDKIKINFAGRTELFDNELQLLGISKDATQVMKQLLAACRKNPTRRIQATAAGRA